MLVWKELKPSRLKVEAIRAEILAEANRTGKDIQKDFLKTVATWKKKPKFEILTDTGPPIAVLVGTDNKIYRFLNDGTDEHVVTPRNKKALRFQPGYITKTSPGFIGSFPGGGYGAYAYSKGHIVGGIDPRNFEKEIQKVWLRPFKRRMQKALSRGAKASGHSIQ